MFRSLLFIPGNNPRFLEKSKVLKPDILCFDLEDSIPKSDKSNARTLVHSIFQTQFEFKSNVFVRINSLDDLPDSSLDIDMIIHKGLTGIVVPKVNNSVEISKLSEKLSFLESKRNIDNGTIKIIPSIETAKGVVNAHSIAESNDRVIAIVFGIYDFLYDMNIDYFESDESIYRYARSKIPVDSRAAGIDALDGIWQNVEDINGLINDTRISKQLGYTGRTIIHPKHIDPVHDVFRYSTREIEWAKKVIDALSNSFEGDKSRGAVTVEGKMVDAVHFKQARLILDSIK